MGCIFRPEALSWEDIDSMAAGRIAEKLTKSATKPDLVRIITHVASAYCWYVSLKARVEKAKGEE